MNIEIPSNAKAVIVAQLDKDESESQSDYYNSKAVRTVAIGWRFTERESFPALLKAAASFLETVELGNKERWLVKAVYSEDCPQANVYAGQRFPFYRGFKGPFKTKAEAQAVVGSYLPLPLVQRARVSRLGGEAQHKAFHKTFHKLEVYPESCEHREKYSMGAGNYLKWGDRHCNGWRVRSLDLESYEPGGSGWPTEWSIPIPLTDEALSGDREENLHTGAAKGKEFSAQKLRYAESKQRALEYEANTKGVAERLAKMGGAAPYQHSPGEFSFSTEAGYVRGQVSGKSVKLSIDRLSEELAADLIQEVLNEDFWGK